jgi:DNA-directed RNA polymerase specialized sigma24 family protein
MAVTTTTSLLPEYEAWMERVCATYEAITYTCHHRLGNRRLAEQVSVQVLAGLLAKPQVFRYFGLPYSGRIARLAESRLAEAQEGRLADVGSWQELLQGLNKLPLEHQEVFVLTCVRGDDDGQLASNLGCDTHTARLRRHSTMELMRELAAYALPPAALPEANNHSNED